MKPMSLLGAVAVIACFVLGPAAPAAGPDARRPINACAFLKDDEVGAALGIKVEPGERSDFGESAAGDAALAGSYSSACLWRIPGKGAVPSDPDLPLGGASFVVLNMMQWPAGSGGGKRFLQNFRDAARSGEIGQEPVPVKIGEEGLWWGDGVAASKGDRGFGVSVHLVGGRDRERGLEEILARKVAGRL